MKTMLQLKQILVPMLLTVPMLTSAQGVVINSANFPDETFRNYIFEYYDTGYVDSEGNYQDDKNKNGILEKEEIDRITDINLNNYNITSLQGIEYFTQLEKLECSCYQLTDLDVSRCTKLKELYCADAQLTSLSLNAALTYLDCSSNQLTSLNVSGCTKLEELRCSSNQLTSLSLNTALTYLDCEGNQLTSLNVSGCTKLKELNCRYNQLTSLSLNAALTLLNCDRNQLTSLSPNAALKELHCSSNELLTSLDVSECIALKELLCNFGQLTSLDVSKNTALTHLDCNNNQLTSLDVSENTMLRYLYCSNNQLKSLDVSKLTALESMTCGGNQLVSLDISGCKALTYLNCILNQLQGAAMDKLIKDLPENTSEEEYKLYIYYEGFNDGNRCTKKHVATAKEKGWIIYYNSWNGWVEYDGFDDDSNSIAQPVIENIDANAPVYNLSGQKVSSPVKGGIYIVDGKKVVVK